jgi:hypothetical protein
VVKDDEVILVEGQLELLNTFEDDIGSFKQRLDSLSFIADAAIRVHASLMLWSLRSMRDIS